VFWHGKPRSAFTSESLADTLNRRSFQKVRARGFKQIHSEYPEMTELDSREAESVICEAIGERPYNAHRSHLIIGSVAGIGSIHEVARIWSGRGVNSRRVSDRCDGRNYCAEW